MCAFLCVNAAMFLGICDLCVTFCVEYHTQRVHIHCRIQFWHICFTPPSLSLSLSLSLFQSPSFSHPPTPQSITLSHTLLIGWIVLNGKKEKGGKKERERWGGYEREIDGGVIGWEKEGDWKREREREIEREKGEWNRCAKIVSYNEYELSVRWRGLGRGM